MKSPLRVGLLAVLLATPVCAQPASPPSFLSPTRLLTVDAAADEVPHVVTDGQTWIAAWKATAPGGDADIAFSRSIDGGGTWSTPRTLNANAETDSGRDFGPHLAVAEQTWVAVWQSRDTLGNTKGTDYDILTAHSADNGVTWSAPRVLNDYGYEDTGDDEAPRIVTDGAGTWMAVWHTVDTVRGTIGADSDIAYATSRNGVDWTPAAPLNVGGALDDARSDRRHDAAAEIATNDDTWIALWHSNDVPPTGAVPDALGRDSDILFARSDDGAVTWTEPQPLTSYAASDTGNDNTPHLGTDRSGTWIAAWRSSDPLSGTVGADQDIFYVRSTDAGLSWSGVSNTPTPSVLNQNAATDVGHDRGIRLVTDGNTWLALWSTRDSLADTIEEDGDIVRAFSTDAGTTWSNPAVVDSAALSDQATDELAELALADGVLVAMWFTRDRQGTVTGDDGDIRVARGFMPAPGCRNGTVDPGEDCDDANGMVGDGCRPDCREEACGNRFLDGGEACDDGNLTNGDGCRATCEPEVCNDGVHDPDEECDDGNAVCGDDCDPNCRIPRCGNDYSCEPTGEQCDDGNTAACDGCDPRCGREECGNDRIDCGEECEDDDSICGDECDPNCRLSRCGNAFPCAAQGEDCDDGNAVCGDGCDPNCRASGCPNGFACATDNEQCDDDNRVLNDGCSVCGFDCQSDTDCAAQRECTPRQCLPTASGLGRACLEAPAPPGCRGCRSDVDCQETPSDDPCTVDTCGSLESGCLRAPKTGPDAFTCTLEPAIAAECPVRIIQQTQRALDEARDVLLKAAGKCPSPKPVAKRLKRGRGLLIGAKRRVARWQARGKISEACGLQLSARLNVPLEKLGGRAQPEPFCGAS